MKYELPEILKSDPQRVVSNVGIEAVEVNRFLVNRFIEIDPAQDPLFQFVFRSYYRLDNAGLTPEFKIRYFELMSEARAGVTVDLRHIVESLKPFPNRKGQNSLQFSFATKLATTINNSYPIYDSEVASVFGFRAPYHYKGFDKRLDEYLDFYSGLQMFYEMTIQSGSINESIQMFRLNYKAAETTLSDLRILDFLMWSAGKILKG